MVRATCEYDAVIVGAGPNGLAAAIRIAQHGFSTIVLERNHEIGGACRTEALTIPGFLHDVGSAIHPLALGSPFFSSLPLQKYGLEWIQPEIPLAHLIDSDQAVFLRKSVDDTAEGLGPDASSYRKLFEPFVSKWENLLAEFLQPIVHLPRHPYLVAKFGRLALASVQRLLQTRFSQNASVRALLGGLAAHSFLPLDAFGSAGFALILGVLGHAVGWPLPRGGAKSIVGALSEHLRRIGGTVQTGISVASLSQLPRSRVVLFDVTPRQLVQIAGKDLPIRYRKALQRFKYGPGIFKIDYALDGPIPWIQEDCAKSGTVHLGGTFEEIAKAESQVSQGRHPRHPFLLLSQPTMFDSTRAPRGCHVVWLYCHVPGRSMFNMMNLIEAQIARFAPGFSKRVIARHITSTVDLEKGNPNLVDGTISGGANNLCQLIARPILSAVPYRTPLKNVYICSSSTPPGGGVHGMCGFHAANLALRQLFRKSS
jgi:phytoene dehydrogenase-like protein